MNAESAPAAPFTGRRLAILLILSLSGFVTAFGAHIVAVNLPTYAAALGVGAFMIGLLIAVYDFAELFAKPVAGFLADRRGMKLTLLAGLALFIAGSLLYLVIDPRYLLIVRFVQGLGAAALSTVSITLVATYFEAGRGKAFGLYNAIKGAGYVTAPAIGGFIVAGYGFSAIFAVSAGVGLVAFLLSCFLPGDAQRKGGIDDDDDISLKTFFEVFADKALLPAYAVILVNMFLVGILFGFLPVYLHGIGYTPVQSGFTVGAATLSYLLVQPLAGYWADRAPIRASVLGGLLLAALAVMATTFLSGPLLLLAVVLAGLGVGTVWTNTDLLVSTLSDKNKLGASMGAAQSFKELGDMVGPLLIGLLTELFGVRVGFVTCAVLALMMLGVLLRVSALNVTAPGRRS